MSAPHRAALSRTAVVIAVLSLLLSVGGLVVYKTSAAIGVVAKAQTARALDGKSQWLDASSPIARPFADALNYLGWVAIALAFGVLIAAVVRAFVPVRWLSRTVTADGFRGHAIAVLAGAPLMLCSCCIAPVFEGVYERTRRLRPSLGLMLAAPALNPAVLAATFLIFPGAVAWTRLSAALVIVFVGATIVARLHRGTLAAESCALDAGPAPNVRQLVVELGRAVKTVGIRTLPAILLGVLLSAAIARAVPLGALGDVAPVAAIAIVALIAVPLALPTFGEIPLALGLLAAGMPIEVATALLVAGPTVNLPSLLSLARATSARVAVGTAACVWSTAVAAGLVVAAI